MLTVSLCHLLLQFQLGHVGLLVDLRHLQLRLCADVRSIDIGLIRGRWSLRGLLLCLRNLFILFQDVEAVRPKQLLRGLLFVHDQRYLRISHQRPDVHKRLRLLVLFHQDSHPARINLIVALDLFFGRILHIEMIVAGQMGAGHLIVPRLDAHPQRHVVGVHHYVGGSQCFWRGLAFALEERRNGRFHVRKTKGQLHDVGQVLLPAVQLELRESGACIAVARVPPCFVAGHGPVTVRWLNVLAQHPHTARGISGVIHRRSP